MRLGCFMKNKFATIFLIGLIFSISISALPQKECPPKDGTIVLRVNIPGVTEDLCTAGATKLYQIIDSNGDKKGDILDFLALSYKFLVGIAGIAAVIAMMVGGYLWLFSGGNSSKVTEAKSIIGSAVLGLFLTIGSFMILNLINPDLVNWRFNPEKIEKPVIVSVSQATHICSSQERADAINSLTNQKDKGSFLCGSVYYENYKAYEDCVKQNPKDHKTECATKREKAFADGCMEVACPADGSADYACVISFDEETGVLTSGACQTNVAITRVEGENARKGLTHRVDRSQLGGKCGGVQVINTSEYDVSNNCDDNSCTILTSDKWVPFYRSFKEAELHWYDYVIPGAWQAGQLGDYAATWLFSDEEINKVASVYHNKSGTKLVPMSCRETVEDAMK